MSLLGTEAPMMTDNGQETLLPNPSQGEEASPYIFEGKSTRNIRGKSIKLKRVWRYKQKYRFVQLSATIYDRLVAAYNAGREVLWVPHSDVRMIAYMVHIEDLELKPYKGLSVVDDVTFTVESVSPVNKVPSIDNMITGHFAFLRGV